MTRLDIRGRIPACPHAPDNAIDQELIELLDDLESELDVELEYTSGFRCEECNREAKGSRNSAHLRGLAVDISCNNSHFRFVLYDAARLLGVARLGPAKGFFHIDVDKSLPQEVTWLYD